MVDTFRYELYHDDEISDAVVQQASELFSEHYGVWSKQAPGKMSGRVRAGTVSISFPSPYLLRKMWWRGVSGKGE